MRTITYPHSNPIILDDDTFVTYGGQTGSSTSAQRTAAYLSAEKKITGYIGAFLLPTVVTGTHTYDPLRNVITDYGYVHSLNSVIVRSRDMDSDCSITETSKCAYIRDDGYGVLDVNYVYSSCGCSPYNVYQIEIAYKSGLPTGTMTQPDYLAYLVAMADIQLKEISGDGGNEGPGDVGISSFSADGYSEKRYSLRKTDLGASPRANWIADGLLHLRKSPGVFL